MPKFLLLVGLIVSVFTLSGFEKLPVVDQWTRQPSIEDWINEATHVQLHEAFQYEETIYAQFHIFTRESDHSQKIFALTKQSFVTDDVVYVQHMDEEEYTTLRSQSDIIFLDDKQKEQFVQKAEFALGEGRDLTPAILKKGVKTADQLILDSHVLGLLTRPVSSSYRLMTWMGGAAEDVLLQDIARYFEDQAIPPLADGEPMDVEAFEERLNELFGDERAYGTMTYYIGGESYFPRQMQAFEQAEDSIDVRIFIFDNDDFGVKLANILKRRSHDVDVKVLIDGMGMIMGEGKVPEGMPAGFVPPASMAKYLQKDDQVDVRIRPNAWFKADHTKTIFIDDNICFTGGMNFGREYRYDWHDLMMELRGPIVQKLHREFDIAWAHAGKLGDLAYLRSKMFKKEKHDPDTTGFLIRPLYTRAKDQQIYHAQLEAIKASKKYIYISNAYFSDNAILYELIRARRRGVDVRVILPVHGNHAIMNKSNMVTANVMFDHGIRVYFYPGMSHIKAAIYDGWMTTGSANFDKLSFRDNVELNIATSDKQAVEELKTRLFEEDFKKSLEMTKKLKVNFQDRLAEFIAEQL